MASKALHRISRSQLTFLALSTVGILALILFFRNGFAAARVVLEAVGTVALTMLIATVLLENWLWKTRLGRLAGFPPNYSGIWEGQIHRTILGDARFSENTKIQVEINQKLAEIEWVQKGISESAQEETISHFILGEVVDHTRAWSGVIGIYEVQYLHEADSEHYGMQLVDISEDGERIRGFYCSTKGNVGKIDLTKVKTSRKNKSKRHKTR